MARKNTQHHSSEQGRAQGSKRFTSDYSEPRLYFALREVALAVKPDDPASLTQAQFDEHAAVVMAKLDEPAPPSARSIYQRLNKPPRKKRSWREQLEAALAAKASDVHLTAQSTRAPANNFADERHIHYSMNRIALLLGHPPAHPGEYDEARNELLRADKHMRRDEILTDLLLNANQLIQLAGDDGWPALYAIAGLEPPPRRPPVRAYSPLTMMTHFYYTNRRLPRRYRELREYASSFDIPMPGEQRGIDYRGMREQFIAERAASGLATPEDGPAPGDELGPEALDALIADAPRLHRRGYWTLERVQDALVEYVTEFDSAEPRLTVKHYRPTAQRRGWPTPSRITDLSKEHDLGGFQAMLDQARKRARLRKAA